ncbi:hypothetical protein Salat_2130100 [Sesamum alatum]|uniref:Uncharacterized protein n=1 Tax=Sesamum alatum TaxID=300844 RepID=A0AAE1Y138_9LAMI|nr:hypothetical protein Salat_2130100 [Sesamum alatum]
MNLMYVLRPEVGSCLLSGPWGVTNVVSEPRTLGSNVPNVGRENYVNPFGDSITVRWDDPPVIYITRPEDQGIGSVPDDVVPDILADRNRVLSTSEIRMNTRIGPQSTSRKTSSMNN